MISPSGCPHPSPTRDALRAYSSLDTAHGEQNSSVREWEGGGKKVRELKLQSQHHVTSSLNFNNPMLPAGSEKPNAMWKHKGCSGARKM